MVTNRCVNAAVKMRAGWRPLLLFLACLGCHAAPVSKTAGTGLSVSADVYQLNLLHLRNNVLPAGWRLAAVQKWNAYGNGITKLAGTAAKLGLPVCVLTNQEAKNALAAAAAAGVKNATIWRIMPAEGPAKYVEIYAAAKQGLNVVEIMSPLNQKDILAAAKAAGKVIPVQIYLFSHYDEKYGYYFTTSKQLEDLVKSLDPKLVKVVGFMTHNGGLEKADALARINQFNQVVCPVAKQLSAKQPVMLHFASSTDIENLMPKGGSRMVAPDGLCQGPNITWWSRFGSTTYGDSSEDNELLKGTAPVLTWHDTVDSVKTDVGPDGKARKVAVVNVAPHRYPATSWWQGVKAFVPSKKSQVPAAAYQPDSYVYINGHRYRLARIPSDGTQVLVDVTRAKGKAVAAGDPVCLLCGDHPVGDLAEEVGADAYNTALCLTGQPPVVGSMEETPKCSPPAVRG